jgi:hypothetical protein
MKDNKVSISYVKEEVQKEKSLKKKRTEKDLTDKELELFKQMYSMHSNQDLAKQFLISEDDVARLGHELKLYKDTAFTEYKMSKSQEKQYLTTTSSESNKATPGYLIAALTNKMTEEERREILTMHDEGLDPVEILDQVIVAQMARVARGLSIEDREDTLFRVVNETVDTLHNMLKTAHELKHGKKLTFSLDEAILRSQGKID